VTEVLGLYGAAPLYALEVDTAEAVGKFKEILQSLGQGLKKKGGERHTGHPMELMREFSILIPAPRKVLRATDPTSSYVN
jgi:hypothetical protein